VHDESVATAILVGMFMVDTVTSTWRQSTCSGYEQSSSSASQLHLHAGAAGSALRRIQFFHHADWPTATPMPLMSSGIAVASALRSVQEIFPLHNYIAPEPPLMAGILRGLVKNSCRFRLPAFDGFY
jgi:hypothetical protein